MENEQQQDKEKSGHEPGPVHCLSVSTHQLYVEALGAATLPGDAGSAGNGSIFYFSGKSALHGGDDSRTQ
jgi:hypothetical protein